MLENEPEEELTMAEEQEERVKPLTRIPGIFLGAEGGITSPEVTDNTRLRSGKVIKKEKTKAELISQNPTSTELEALVQSQRTVAKYHGKYGESYEYNDCATSVTTH